MSYPPDDTVPMPRSPALATDLYEITMAAAYHANRRHERATFELFVRHMPENRSYLVVAGLRQALDYLRGLRFSDSDIGYIRNLPVFAHVSEAFFEYLATFRFSGDVRAMAEGTPVFEGEPLLRVTAPIIEAQIIETYLLGTINFQTMIATKAARIVDAAQGRGVIEFGARRAHGMEAALYAARAAFIGGCIGTSNVESGHRFDMPVYGTAAHSWTMSFEQEIDAFRAYHRVFPESTVLLLDTYDTMAAAHLATEFGPGLLGVRIDSGDLAEQAGQVRAILDEAGMGQTRILASGDLNEYKIAELLTQGAPIDLFGVGTELSTSRDAPALAGVYKLVDIEIDHTIHPKMKLSQDKDTYPFRKQVWRECDDAERFVGDIITMADEKQACGEPLLTHVMQDGGIIADLPTLHEIQAYATRQRERLSDRYKALSGAEPYPVRYSDRLEYERQKLLEELKQAH